MHISPNDLMEIFLYTFLDYFNHLYAFALITVPWTSFPEDCSGATFSEGLIIH